MCPPRRKHACQVVWPFAPSTVKTRVSATWLRSSERERLSTEQLVASASEAILLNAWDVNTGYDFLNGQTPKQRLDELKPQPASIRSIGQNTRDLIPNLTDAELLNYLDLSRRYRGLEAMGWLLQCESVTTTPPLEYWRRKGRRTGAEREFFSSV